MTFQPSRFDWSTKMDFRTFADSNRLRVKWNGVEDLILGKYGELADMGDESRFRLRLLAVPRSANMDRTLRNRRHRALTGGLELKWKSDAESIFYFDLADAAQVNLVVELVGAKRRRTMSPEQRIACAERLASIRKAA
jgi:hypothetical protein